MDYIIFNSEDCIMEGFAINFFGWFFFSAILLNEPPLLFLWLILFAFFMVLGKKRKGLKVTL